MSAPVFAFLSVTFQIRVWFLVFVFFVGFFDTVFILPSL